ncbi:MAG: S-adenosylmethionine:tRNA ribosyltransferase-isomerase [Acidimicrobiales bacterium]
MTTSLHDPERLDFDLPHALEAAEPPEARGLTRDAVRMLVAYKGSSTLLSSRFIDLPEFLAPGDLLVVNTSGTIPAAIDARDGSSDLVVHLSTRLTETRWVVEPRRRQGLTTQRWTGPAPGPRLGLRGGRSLELVEPYGDGPRLWVADLDLGQPALRWLETHGRPIRYGYVERAWPIATYQNVYASVPGSAEMPSAGRPFTTAMITRLVAMGVDVAPLVLHTGVASLEVDEAPYPERVSVPAATAERVNLARRLGGRVVAVGTTVVRALESAIGPDGRARARDGWTDLVVRPDYEARLVDGVLTGWHEPVSSHLWMLEALAGRDLLADSYQAALTQGYRWHEFGDVHLILA